MSAELPTALMLLVTPAFAQASANATLVYDALNHGRIDVAGLRKVPRRGVRVEGVHLDEPDGIGARGALLAIPYG
ncbi:hypothetical protein GCM10010289_59730 [Streptomyces violascens]|nr:hypothetical protein GCM10010289_59730 [Streptomyces violascens]